MLVFVERLRTARQEAGLTQVELAKKLKRPQSYVSNVCRIGTAESRCRGIAKIRKTLRQGYRLFHQINMNNEIRNVLIAVVVLALVGGAYYFGTTSKSTGKATITPTTESTPAPTPAAQPVKEQPVVKQSALQPATNNEVPKVATTDELQACANQAKFYSILIVQRFRRQCTMVLSLTKITSMFQRESVLV